MARYEIDLKDDTVIHADDARFVSGGRFLEIIPRKAKTIHGSPETLLLNSDLIDTVQHKAIGFKGGWRFTGDKDSGFDKTEGSV